MVGVAVGVDCRSAPTSCWRSVVSIEGRADGAISIVRISQSGDCLLKKSHAVIDAVGDVHRNRRRAR